jgi:MFS family permease
MYDVVLQVPVIELPWEEFALLFITALAGGAFGAALGALPAFIFTGFVVFLGEGLGIVNRQLGGTDLAVGQGELAGGLSGVIGFGAVTGPHIAFAGGVAATAYAGKKYPEMEPDDWDYHFGKDILYAFGTKPDILAVGAVFGALGMLITQLGEGLFINVLEMQLPTDFIAFSVFATAMIARPVFGYPLIGKPKGSGILDMSPFEREEAHPRAVADGGEVPMEHEGRLATEPWLPHQYKWSGVASIGLVGGILGGYIYILTGSIFMGYAISAISLLFLNLGVEKIPVTHHITLIGAVGAVVFLPDYSPVVALLAAGAFGAVSGLLGELTQRIFYAHSGTHVDPPAMAITIAMVGVVVLEVLGVLPNAGYL